MDHLTYAVPHLSTKLHNRPRGTRPGTHSPNRTLQGRRKSPSEMFDIENPPYDNDCHQDRHHDRYHNCLISHVVPPPCPSPPGPAGYDASLPPATWQGVSAHASIVSSVHFACEDTLTPQYLQSHSVSRSLPFEFLASVLIHLPKHRHNSPPILGQPLYHLR